MQTADASPTQAERMPLLQTPFYLERVRPVVRYLRRNRLMSAGLIILVCLALFVVVSMLFYRQENIYGEVHGVGGLVVELTGPPEVRPSWNPWGEWP